MGSSVNSNRNSNIYEFNAASALAEHGAFVEGTPNCTLAVISAQKLPDDARTALISSGERLGFGRAGILWVVCEASDGTTISSESLRALLTACDPLAFVAADATAAERLAAAFDAPCELDAATRLQGRNLVAFASFPEMLAAPEAKQRAWALLKKLSHP